MRVCANPNCSETTNIINPSLRCATCEAYRQRTGDERPLQLVLWPAHGHPLLSTVALCKMTGITYRRMDHAIRTGWLKPTVPANGSGTSRGFTFDDAVRAVVGFECAPFATQERDASVAVCGDLAQLRIRTGEFSEFVVDVDAIRENLLERWPAEYAMDLDAEARELVLGQVAAA